MVFVLKVILHAMDLRGLIGLFMEFNSLSWYGFCLIGKGLFITNNQFFMNFSKKVMEKLHAK